MTQIKRIGVLTSGGDSPGMNAAIRAVVRTGMFYELEIFGIRRGFEGLINGDYFQMDRKSVSNIIQRGGTMLKTARSEKFKTPEGRKQAHDQLVKNGIDALVAIGGNGTFIGAEAFVKETGFPVIGLPGTIDNDLVGTDFTIGYDTAINTAIEAIDKIRDTAESHARLFIVEVMGRDSGLIALRTGMGAGAESVLVPDASSDLESLFYRLEYGRKDKSARIVIVAESEQPGAAFEIGRLVKEKFPNYDTRVSVLGHIQRGGRPSCMDRVLASRLGVAAVERLLAGHSNEMVGLVHGEITYTPLDKAIKHHVTINQEFKRIVEILSL
jgi:6-phosphofructokinase 1